MVFSSFSERLLARWLDIPKIQCSQLLAAKLEEKSASRDGRHRNIGRFGAHLDLTRAGDDHEKDFSHYGSRFRVHYRHGDHHRPFAGNVMKEVMTFLVRGFALFAGGPVFISSARGAWR
jgi:hypothetical protein